MPVPAIVTPELFEAAREQLDRNRRFARRNATPGRFLLQGLTVCSNCSYSYCGASSGSYWRGRKRTYTYYRCSGRSPEGTQAQLCDNRPVRSDHLDEYVWTAVRRVIEDPARMSDEWTRRGDSDTEQSRLQEQLDASSKAMAKQERVLQRLVDAYQAEAIGLDDLKERSRRIRGRIDQLEDEQAQLQTQLNDATALREVVARMKTFAQTVRTRLDDVAWDERQRLIRLLVARVEIDGQGATVVFRIPSASPDREPDDGQRINGGGTGTSAGGGQFCSLRRTGHALAADPLGLDERSRLEGGRRSPGVAHLVGRQLSSTAAPVGLRYGSCRVGRHSSWVRRCRNRRKASGHLPFVRLHQTGPTLARHGAVRPIPRVWQAAYIPPPPTRPTWRRRDPEGTVLHTVFRGHLEQFLADLDAQGRPLPGFVRSELRAYLRCGVMAWGFQRLACDACGGPRLVGLSCGGRGFCPSCCGRRMAQTAASLVDHVLPWVPMRQWVLSLPWNLRLLAAFDHSLLLDLHRALVRSLFSWQRARARAAGLVDPRCAAVTHIQRFASDLSLAPHFHLLAPDGVFHRPRLDRPPVFHALRPPTDSDVCDVVEGAVRRAHRALIRRGVDPHDPRRIEAACEDLFESDPSLAQLAAASSQRRLALGRNAGMRPATLGVHPPEPPELGTPEARRRSRLCAEADGFNLHAGVCVGAHERDRLERLCRYLARPPIPDERLEQLDEDTIAIRFKRPRRDGVTHVLPSPLGTASGPGLAAEPAGWASKHEGGACASTVHEFDHLQRCALRALRLESRRRPRTPGVPIDPKLRRRSTSPHEDPLGALDPPGLRRRSHPMRLRGALPPRRDHPRPTRGSRDPALACDARRRRADHAGPTAAGSGPRPRGRPTCRSRPGRIRLGGMTNVRRPANPSTT